MKSTPSQRRGMPKAGFAASMKSENGIYHKAGAGCHHLHRVGVGNVIRFRTAERAQKRGLHLCSWCRQRMHQKTLREYCTADEER
jgi:hypothetical protein